MPRYQIDQRVQYKPIGGPDSKTPVSLGTIMNVITKNGRMAGHNVKASEEDPRYEIKNEKSGKKSAIYETSILRLAKP